MSVFGRRLKITFWHLFLFLATAAFAADFIVTNTNDAGPGSLRAAIDDVNTNGNATNRILFAIPGPGVQRITVSSSFNILSRQVEIDGTSQGDTTAGPLIELVGAYPSNLTPFGFVSFEHLIVRRLSIGGFTVGLDFATTGESYGNYLGLAADGTPIPNLDGLVAGNGPVIIGGNTTSLRNVVSSNVSGGIFVNPGVARSTIQGNYIGVGPDGTTARPNGFAGIDVFSAADVIGNTIASNGGDGVRVETKGVRILNNSIFSNGLTGIGFTFLGANNNQASPVITTLQSYPSSTRVAGTLTSAPNESFTAQFFSNPVAEQEGRTFLGQVTVNTDGAGLGTFDTVLAANVPQNNFVTSTATRISTNDTSMFSADVQAVLPGVIAFDSATFSTGEAAGTANLTLSRTGGSDGAVQVDLNVTGGSATNGTDYTAPATTVSFAAGVTTATVPVPINSDALDEIDETVTFAISNPTNGAMLGAQSTTTLTIIDDDTAGITVVPTTITTTEAGGTGGFTVVLNSQPLANVTIGISSSDLTEGTSSASSLTFTPANWNIAQPVTITGVDDAIADGPQPYTIVIAPAVSTDPAYNGLDATDVSATNADNEAAASITISDAAPLIGGPATFTVTLSVVSGSTVSVSYATANGTATAGSDYVATSGVVTFTPGQTSQLITVQTTPSAGAGETFFVNLTAPVNASIADNQGQAVISSVAIPTLSEWMLLALVAMIAIIGAAALKGA